METPKSTEIVPLKDVERMAMVIAKSGLFGVKNPEQALALMLLSQAEGLHPAIAARDYDIINGKPAKKSEAMLRSFLQSGGSVEWHTLDDTCADATFSHPAGGKVRMSWDMKRAKAAGLSTKDVWLKYPRQMLRSRLISEGVRTVCPMATSGMYVTEEVHDMDEPKDVTPKKVETVPTPVTELSKEVEKTINNNPTNFISDAQRVRLFTIAKSNGYTEADIKTYLKEYCGIESSKQILKSDYDAIVNDFSELSESKLAERQPHGVV